MWFLTDGMNPSANSTQEHGDLSWPSENWDHPVAATVCCGGLDSRHFQANRLDWDWESPMLLAPHSVACSGDQEPAECKPTIMADALGPSVRQSNGLLPSSFPSNFSQNTWGVLNPNVMRDRGDNMLGSSQSLQASSAPFHHAGLGTSGMYAFSTGNASYGEARSTFEQHRHLLGLVNIDQRRISDIVKREIYSSPDFSARIGLNLGGRTYFATEDHNTLARFGKRHRPNSPGAQVPMCQAEGCKADLSIAKHYHRRHKVCEFHSKAATVIIGGQTQRFCQQCSRFHVLSEFDEGKRSCRKRLADHNRRRRKPQANSSSTTPSSTAELTAPKTEEKEQNSNDNDSSSGDKTKAVASSEAQAILSNMSLAPSVSITLQDGKQQIPLLPRSPEKQPYQQYLQVGRTGSSLSLSTLGGGGTTSVTSQRQSAGHNLSGLDATVPWLRPIVPRHSTNGASDDSSPSRVQFLENAGRSSTMQAFSHAIQNLLPSRHNSKDHINDSDWIMKNMTGQRREHLEEFGSQNLNLMKGKLESQEALSLLERGGMREIKTSENRISQNGHTLEFMQQRLPSATNTTDVSENHSITGNHHNVKFQGFSGLGAFNQSLYSNCESLL